jgi:hypothetical protein
MAPALRKPAACSSIGASAQATAAIPSAEDESATALRAH